MPRKADLHAFLDEDVGRGDLTSQLIVDRALHARAVIFPREPCVLAGLEEAGAVFKELGVAFEAMAADGQRIRANAPAAAVEGKARSILKGERVALNLLQRMSGIATLTRRLVERGRLANPRLIVAATRKTTPGFRAFEKRAVVLGGGDPHRFALDDMILIKDNHHALTGGVRASMELLAGSTGRPFGKKVEVEVATTDEALEAARLGADIVMLDNFGFAALRRAHRELKARYPRVVIEVSGGIDEASIGKVAPFADVVSVGALTHSPKAIDFTLEFAPKEPRGRARSPAKATGGRGKAR